MSQSVAEIVCVFPPYGGGIGVVARDNARDLSRDGSADVTVYTPRYVSHNTRPHSEKTAEGVRVYRLRPLLAFGNAAVLVQLVWLVRRHTMIHLHCPFIGATLPTLVGVILWRKKLVITYHMDLIGLTWYHRIIFFIYMHIILPPALMRSDRIFVTSHAYAKRSVLAHHFFRLTKRVREMPLSVDTDYFFPGRKENELLSRYGIRDKARVILFVGGLDRAHYFKGVDVLLDACARLVYTISNFHVVIVGDGDLRPVYERECRALGLADVVHFAGNVSDAQTGDHLRSYYRSCDVFVLPSTGRSEAFGIVLLEAGACGKASVVTALPGPADVVVHGVTGMIVPPHDSRALARTLEVLLRDSERADAMGRAARARIEEHYASRVIAELFRREMTAI